MSEPKKDFHTGVLFLFEALQIAVYGGTRGTASGGQEPFWKKVLGSPKTFKKA
jgi:hypothetical protein